jgi:hypothetical protein
MNLLTREQLISAFTPEDQPALSLPAFDHIQWDNLDYLGWCDRTGSKAFLVFDTDGETSGIALDRMAIRTTSARSFMCSLCRTVHGMSGIASYTYKCRRGTGYHTLTDMFCGNLQCSLYVRGILAPDGLQFYETISVDRKVERLHEGMERFLGSLSSFESRHRPRPKLRLV